MTRCQTCVPRSRQCLWNSSLNIWNGLWPIILIHLPWHCLQLPNSWIWLMSIHRCRCDWVHTSPSLPCPRILICTGVIWILIQMCPMLVFQVGFPPFLFHHVFLVKNLHLFYLLNYLLHSLMVFLLLWQPIRSRSVTPLNNTYL